MSKCSDRVITLAGKKHTIEGGYLKLIKTEHDVIRFMKRFPDKISTTKMMAKVWKCSTCLKEFRQDKEVVSPAPCETCSGIFFEKLS